MFQGESSRMYQRLVDKDQIALDVSSAVEPAFDPTMVEVVAQPKQGVDPQVCEKAIYEELERAASASVSDTELEKAKNIRLVEFYRQMRTINGRANTIGTYEVFFGDYNKLFEAAKNYSAVTKEDVQRVAKTYFGANNRTVATLIRTPRKRRNNDARSGEPLFPGRRHSCRSGIFGSFVSAQTLHLPPHEKVGVEKWIDGALAGKAWRAAGEHFGDC